MDYKQYILKKLGEKKKKKKREIERERGKEPYVGLGIRRELDFAGERP